MDMPDILLANGQSAASLLTNFGTKNAAQVNGVEGGHYYNGFIVMVTSVVVLVREVVLLIRWSLSKNSIHLGNICYKDNTKQYTQIRKFIHK